MAEALSRVRHSSSWLSCCRLPDGKKRRYVSAGRALISHPLRCSLWKMRHTKGPSSPCTCIQINPNTAQILLGASSLDTHTHTNKQTNKQTNKHTHTEHSLEHWTGLFALFEFQQKAASECQLLQQKQFWMMFGFVSQVQNLSLCLVKWSDLPVQHLLVVRKYGLRHALRLCQRIQHTHLDPSPRDYI